MRRLPGWQSVCVLVGSAAVGGRVLIGISLDVTYSADPVRTKNCFAHLGTQQTLSEAKDKDKGIGVKILC